MSGSRQATQHEASRSNPHHLNDLGDSPGQLAPPLPAGLPVESQPEYVELGLGSNLRFVDDRADVVARPRPHGLLPVPTEVEDIVANEEARLLSERGITPMPEARQRMVDSLSLQYYFDGIDIAYRHSPRGVEVLAIGLDEIQEFVKSTPPEQREDVVFGQG